MSRIGHERRSITDQQVTQINHLHQGRGFYFRDPDGHTLEVITHSYM
jgi:hypothetical protein